MPNECRDLYLAHWCIQNTYNRHLTCSRCLLNSCQMGMKSPSLDAHMPFFNLSLFFFFLRSFHMPELHPTKILLISLSMTESYYTHTSIHGHLVGPNAIKYHFWKQVLNILHLSVLFFCSFFPLFFFLTSWKMLAHSHDTVWIRSICNSALIYRLVAFIGFLGLFPFQFILQITSKLTLKFHLLLIYS